MAEGGGGVGEGAEVDAVADEVDAVGGYAGVEEAVGYVVGDGDDGGVVAEETAVDDTVEPEEWVVVVPGVAGGDERCGGLAQGEVGVDVGLVAVGVEEVGAGGGGEGADGGGDGAVELAVAGDEVGLDAFGEGAFVELEVGVGGVGEDAQQAGVTLLVEGAGEVEDDGFGTVHTATGDEVEDPHGCGTWAVAGSVSGS